MLKVVKFAFFLYVLVIYGRVFIGHNDQVVTKGVIKIPLKT